MPVVRLKRAQALRMVGREEGMMEVGLGWLSPVGGQELGDYICLRKWFCRYTVEYMIVCYKNLPELWFWIESKEIDLQRQAVYL